MKILTLTTQFANNMGALLQCYALSKCLNQIEDVQCEVVDYWPKDSEKSWRLFHKPVSFRDFVKMCIGAMMLHHYYLRAKRNKKVRAFIDKYIPLTSATYNREEIVNNPPVADCFVCGSDQIWNPKLFDDLTYYFDFVKSGKKIAYAASATKVWNDAFAMKIQKSLQEFSAISMREDINIEQVSRLSGIKAVTVIDPVFLLSANQWLEMADVPALEDPYILCYFIGTKPEYGKYVELMRKQTGCKVVHLNVNMFSHIKADYEIRDVDPLSFVGYISKAKYVFTNSFHCTAFSLIFQKNVKVVRKPEGNSRIDMLSKLFHIDNLSKPISEMGVLSDGELDTDYTNIQDAKDYIQQSKQFLYDAIK